MDETGDTRRFWSGGLVVSLLLHGLVAAVLIGGVTKPLPEPEEAVAVILVPPPEEAEVVEQEEEPQPPEEAQPEEQPQPDEELPSEDQAAPETAPPEATPPETAPPEAEEPAPEEAAPEALEKPAPEDPAPGEQVPPEPTPEETAEGDAQDIPVLKPVVEFGETDSGSEVAPDGDAAEAGEQTEPDETEAEQPEPELAELEQAEPEQVEPEAPEAAAAPETAEAEPADPLEAPEPEASDTELPELEAAGTEFPEPDLPPSEVAMSLPVLASENGAEPLGDAASALPRLAAPLPKPAAGPSEAASAAAPSGPMTEAKELFSTAMLDGERARTAMAGMPPSERVDVLCMTELRAQLNAADPPRPPELLPSFRVQPGTVLEPRNAAFRSRGLWYELAFRCETDAGATRVVKFSHRIGAAIPRTEWRQRGFPSF